MTRRLTASALVLAVAATLSACGGSGADTTPRTQATTLRVMGDSLADDGTFGIKFTIQGNDIYPERISALYGLGKGCNFFVFTGTTFAPNTATGCTDYAIGGGVINPASGQLTAGDPRGIGAQFAAATAAGDFASTDLLLVDGGGNDAAALVGAYLAAATDGGASYVALLSTLLTPEQVAAAVAGGQAGLATAGGQYMAALADDFHGMIQAGALDKGATRIALLNMPGITNTPRFQMVLDGIALANGGGDVGAAARAAALQLFQGWVVAYNTELARSFAGEDRVAIVDFYTNFNDEITNPAQYGLTNVTTPACPVTGVGSDGLPTYDFATCTNAALDAAPPEGASGAGWYDTWAFSDGFHPSPYGHQLLSQLISLTLAQKGWL